MEKINLSVPFACTESWDAMNEVHQGRHCAVCQTTVYDFASMTDEEITNFFLNYKGGKLCGRVVEQTSALSLQRRIAKRTFSLRAIFVGLSLMAALTTSVRAGNIDPSDREHVMGKMAPANVIENPALGYAVSGKIEAKDNNYTNSTIDLYVGKEKKLTISVLPDGSFATTIPSIFYEQGFYLKARHGKKTKRSSVYKMADIGKNITITFK